jgi:hypothetical protein
MSRVRVSYRYIIAVLLAILLSVLPACAYSVAMYGTNTGLNPDFHKDSVTVITAIPGSTGSDLDTNIDMFIRPSVDVIALGGADTFTPSTAAKIDSAVAGGKILVIAYPCNHLFDASLPATNGGTAPAGQYFEVADPANTSSKTLFSGLPKRFSLQGIAPEKEQAVAKSGAVTILSDDYGLPVLVAWSYGRGIVIEWTTDPVPSYMTGQQADTIIDRLINRALPAPSSTPVTASPTTVVTITPTLPPENATVTINPTSSIVSPVTSGDVVVYSSPNGASILIDGVYYGVTPANLTGIQQGNHIIRLTQSGFYDYEGTIYVIPGQTAHAFGTLPPLGQASGVPTAVPTAVVPIIVPIVTAAPTPSGGLLDNSNVIVAIIGVFTALIAAGVSVFTHVFKAKKE